MLAVRRRWVGVGRHRRVRGHRPRSPRSTRPDATWVDALPTLFGAAAARRGAPVAPAPSATPTPAAAAEPGRTGASTGAASCWPVWPPARAPSSPAGSATGCAAASRWPRPGTPSCCRRRPRRRRRSGRDAEVGVAGVGPYLTPNGELLPDRHGARRAAGGAGELAAAGARHGRPRAARSPTTTCSPGRWSSASSPWPASPTRWAATSSATPAGWAPRSPTCSARRASQPGADAAGRAARSTAGPCGTPTSVVLDGRDALLAVGMNGEPLPVDARLPGPARGARALRLRLGHASG